MRNDFFGPSVTVAGLVTGGDIIKQYGDLKVDEVLIPRVMLRDGGDVFLDNVPRTELEKRLGCPVTPVYTSISVKAWFCHSQSAYTRSRVTPGVSSTIDIRLPAILLKNVDLPTLGRPTTATIWCFWIPPAVSTSMRR